VEVERVELPRHSPAGSTRAWAPPSERTREDVACASEFVVECRRAAAAAAV
jgi:hypothetical protein